MKTMKTELNEIITIQGNKIEFNKGIESLRGEGNRISQTKIKLEMERLRYSNKKFRIKSHQRFRSSGRENISSWRQGRRNGSSSKGNVNSQNKQKNPKHTATTMKNQGENIQEIWDNIKRQKLCIISAEGGAS